MKNLFIASLLITFLAGCSAKVDEDGAEVKIDNDTQESVKETWNNAGRELEKGAEKAKEKLEDAGDAIKDSFNDTKERLSDDKDAKVEVEVKKD
jgi:vacuolar-type H+-ATPase subunit E/Vma4